MPAPRLFRHVRCDLEAHDSGEAAGLELVRDLPDDGSAERGAFLWWHGRPVAESEAAVMRKGLPFLRGKARQYGLI